MTPNNDFSTIPIVFKWCDSYLAVPLFSWQYGMLILHTKHLNIGILTVISLNSAKIAEKKLNKQEENYKLFIVSSFNDCCLWAPRFYPNLRNIKYTVWVPNI